MAKSIIPDLGCRASNYLGALLLAKTSGCILCIHRKTGDWFTLAGTCISIKVVVSRACGIIGTLTATIRVTRPSIHRVNPITATRIDALTPAAAPVVEGKRR